jgi:tetratricopeptide (TPR) repeat protein
MLDEISFNSTLKVREKTLQVQTSFFEAKRKIASSIFDGGQLIDKRDSIIKDEDVQEEILRKKVKQFHELILSDLRLLFSLADKVGETNNVDLAIKLGQLFFERGLYDEAIELFSAARKIDAAAKNLEYFLGLCYYEKKDFNTALNYFQQETNRSKDYPDLRLVLAKTYWELKDPVSSFKSLDEAIRLNSSYDMAFFYYGLYLLSSIQTFPKHAELPPPIERIKKATEHLRKAASLSSQVVQDRMQLGFENLQIKNNLEEAVSHFEKAIEQKKHHLSSDLPDNEFYIKFMFAKLETDSESLSYYIDKLEQSVSFNPDFADHRRSLGLAYMVKAWQYFVRAVKELRKTVEINPSFDKAKRNLKLLENEVRGLLLLLRAILK